MIKNEDKVQQLNIILEDFTKWINGYQEFYYLRYFKELFPLFKIPNNGLDMLFMSCLVDNGFFLMFSGELLPKIHFERCVIPMDKLEFNPSEKSIKKLLFYRKMKNTSKWILKFNN